MTDNPDTGRVPPVAGAASDESLARLDQLIARLDQVVTTLEAAGRDLAETHSRVSAVQTNVERVVAMLGELPGAGLVRRFTGGRDEAPPPANVPRPPPEPYGDAPPEDFRPTRPTGRRGRRG